MDLSQYLIAAAPFGGPIALIRDTNQIIDITRSSTRPQMQVFSSAGLQLSAFAWERGHIVKLGWSHEESLVVVLDDGTVQLYDILGTRLKQFTMGPECLQDGVLDCCIWGGGVVCLTGMRQLVAVESFVDPSARLMADPMLDAPPHSMAVIEPQHTASRCVEVLLATESGTILVVDYQRSQDQLLSNGPFNKMAVAPTGKILACYTESGSLWVVSIDFQKNLSEFNTHKQDIPDQVVWCGTDSVLVCWDRLVIMVGPFGDYIQYPYDEPVYLVPESDGVRIVSNSLCEFVHRVPDSTHDVYAIDSLHASATLLDALQHFDNRSPKADDGIRSIRSDLADAVDNCIEAAAHEFSADLQRQLLRAAAFGKNFLEFHDAEIFVTMCKTLRVLNAVRHYQIGIPITYPQYQKLTPAVLVDRLVMRREYLLALRICNYLKLNKNRVLVHWACEKVKTSTKSDEQIRMAIVSKLADAPGISYAEVAAAAHAASRKTLAIELLENEPRAADQVPLLLTMHEDELALVKAIESGDTDLVQMVLTRLRSALSELDFQRLIHNKPLAANLFIVNAQLSEDPDDHDLVRRFFHATNRSDRATYEFLRGGCNSEDPQERQDVLMRASEFFKDMKDEWAQKITKDQATLLRVQAELEKGAARGEEFYGLSIAQTITNLVLSNQHKKAARIASEFDVPDKQFWWLKLKALAQLRDWDSLDKFSREKKPPIGFEPFVEVCIEARMPEEAMKYISRVTVAKRKVDYLVQLGKFREAADAAAAARQPELLADLRQKCAASAQPQVMQYIESLMAQMNK
eukprot:TRINITY_DN8167_c0_g1_i1.p1 TRINITY_DN8167_c0_g1~~TRINITY_DN8167_c0_g1_i1.p1  ORF type:complete len:850 (-),score=211.21 TRINITY_DN8167_c0_g1_i1:1962-4364(-)